MGILFLIVPAPAGTAISLHNLPDKRRVSPEPAPARRAEND
jgi:hypothetical protein